VLPGAHVQLRYKIKQNEGQSFPKGTTGFVANKASIRMDDYKNSINWYIVQTKDGTFFEAPSTFLIQLTK